MALVVTLITGPAVEPVTLAQAKLHLRVDMPEDDTLIEGLIIAARQWVEQYCRRALVSQTWELHLDSWPSGAVYLPWPPLVSVTSIKGTDEAGVETTVSASNYQADTFSVPGRVTLKSTGTWPATTLRPGGCAVRYVAGYGAAADVPQVFKQAILLLVGHLYENREDVIATGVTAAAVPMGAKTLLWPYRVMRFDL